MFRRNNNLHTSKKRSCTHPRSHARDHLREKNSCVRPRRGSLARRVFLGKKKLICTSRKEIKIGSDGISCARKGNARKTEGRDWSTHANAHKRANWRVFSEQWNAQTVKRAQTRSTRAMEGYFRTCERTNRGGYFRNRKKPSCASSHASNATEGYFRKLKKSSHASSCASEEVGARLCDKDFLREITNQDQKLRINRGEIATIVRRFRGEEIVRISREITKILEDDDWDQDRTFDQKSLRWGFSVRGRESRSKITN